MIYSTAKLKDLSIIIDKIKEKTFDINTQYKFIKISKAIKEEEDYVNEQQFLLLKQYAERDDAGKFIATEDGGFKIRKECIQECGLKIIEMNNRQFTLPDIYFSLEELGPLELTFGELELLEPFIK